MKFIIVLLLIGCAPINQQYASENASEGIPEEDRKQIVISEVKFQNILNSDQTASELVTPITPNILINSKVENQLNIIDYGTIKAGKFINSSGNFSAIDIIGDYMFVPIKHSGGYPIGKLTICDLVWDSEYEKEPNGDVKVNLVLSFKHLDIRRAMITRKLRIDLTPLRIESSKSILINLLGYNKTLKYEY